MNGPSLLAKSLTGPNLLRLAGDLYYQRGVDYFRRGLVKSLEIWENTIQAVVHGSEDYEVEIAAGPRGLDFSCSCPLGQDELFCKHLVATGLAWLAAQAAPPPAEAGGKTRASVRPGLPSITAGQIAETLRAEDHAALVELVLEWARDDAALRAKLVQHTALAMGPEAAAREVKRALEKAIGVRGYVSYQEVDGYAGRVHAAIDSLARLLAAGNAVAAIELSQTALRWLAAAIESVDDSDGQMSELMERVQETHLRACEAARPDPTALAKRLFQAEVAARYGEFHDSAGKYAQVLGETGLKAFRSLAEAEWARVPGRGPEDRLGPGEGHGAITAIMESLARHSGDVEQLVAVLERNLSSAYSYLNIAEAYLEAAKPDSALEWAEKGLAAFPARTDSRLRLFAAEQYQGRGRHPEALRLVWLEFAESARLDTYRQLERFARQDEDWDDWRERALAHIRREFKAKRRPEPVDAIVHTWANRRRDHSLLVEIFLYELKPEDAWCEAEAGGCSDALWLALAEARQSDKPEQCVPVFLRLAEAQIMNAPGHRYDDAVRLLEKAAGLKRALGQSSDFERYLDELRGRHKAKRNFQKLVEARKARLYPR
jgi:uncharacterized Zn finger protein